MAFLIILVLEKCNLDPRKVLEFCTLSLLRTLVSDLLVVASATRFRDLHIFRG